MRVRSVVGLATLGLLGLVVISCNTPGKSESNAKSTTVAGWSGQMQNMAKDVKQLLPFLYDREAFEAPENRETVHQYLKDFAAAAQHVNPVMGKQYLGDDLLVGYALASLKDDLNRSVKSYEVGQFEYSRSVAKASLGYCFQCHSVTVAGASAAWELDQLQQLKLAPLEKADLLVATRKYDKALSHMEGLLTSEDFKRNYAFDFESLLRRYMALILRAEKDPARALRELDKIAKDKNTPQYIRDQAEGWRVSLKSWSKEKKQTDQNAKALFENVDQRFKKADQIQQFEKDHAGDVEYLRITEQLHQGLGLLKSPADQARALFLLGKAYEVLDGLGSWNLHEVYYEACVKRAPKTPIATRCYGRLEASLFMGYSGSSGTHLPIEERDRLKNLKDLL